MACVIAGDGERRVGAVRLHRARDLPSCRADLAGVGGLGGNLLTGFLKRCVLSCRVGIQDLRAHGIPVAVAHRRPRALDIPRDHRSNAPRQRHQDRNRDDQLHEGETTLSGMDLRGMFDEFGRIGFHISHNA